MFRSRSWPAGRTRSKAGDARPAADPRHIGRSSCTARPSEEGDWRQALPPKRGSSLQQTAQIGIDRSCGGGVPQRVREAGETVQLIAPMGLRSTRTIARQREVGDGGTSSVSEPESLRKTHLTPRRRLQPSWDTLPWRQYTRSGLRNAIPIRALRKRRVLIQVVHCSFGCPRMHGLHRQANWRSGAVARPRQHSPSPR